MSNTIHHIAVLADIHANLEALAAVLHDVESNKVSTIVCLGDIVGYGPEPRECLNLIREKATIVVAGNHDLSAATGDMAPDMNPDAMASLRWTAATIRPEDKAFLCGLPLEAGIGPFHFVHGSPEAPSRFHYILDTAAAQKGFLNSKKKIIFTGHSHLPAAFVEVEFSPMFAGCIHRVESLALPDIGMSPGKRYLINVGSVGQPRDGDPRAAYGLMDLSRNRFELIRVSYDVKRAARKIQECGLPDSLAKRLTVGR
jgi:predicted phosphodiesterase